MIKNGAFGDFFAAESWPYQRKGQAEAEGKEKAGDVGDDVGESERCDSDDEAPETVGGDADGVGAEYRECEFLGVIAPDALDPGAPRADGEAEQGGHAALAQGEPKEYGPDAAGFDDMRIVGAGESGNEDNLGDNPGENGDKHKQYGARFEFGAAFVCGEQNDGRGTEDEEEGDELDPVDGLVQE